MTSQHNNIKLTGVDIGKIWTDDSIVADSHDPYPKGANSKVTTQKEGTPISNLKHLTDFVKQIVCVGVISHAESKSKLNSELNLLLHCNFMTFPKAREWVKL